MTGEEPATPRLETEEPLEISPVMAYCDGTVMAEWNEILDPR